MKDHELGSKEDLYALDVLTSLGLVGWCDGKRPSRYCSLDPECARAVISGPGPLLDRLVSLSQHLNTSMAASQLLKQLYLALDRPEYLNKVSVNGV